MMKTFSVFTVFALFFLSQTSLCLFACEDYYLEWNEVEVITTDFPERGVLGPTDIFLKLKSELFAAKILKWNDKRVLMLGFAGWGGEEKPVNPEQFEDLKLAMETVWFEQFVKAEKEKLVSAPDYDKLGKLAASETNALAISIVVKEYRTEWKNYITQDFSSIFKMRNMLIESMKAEVKIVDNKGELVFLKEIEVKPNLCCDYTWETNGLFELMAYRYSYMPMMNMVAKDIPTVKEMIASQSGNLSKGEPEKKD